MANFRIVLKTLKYAYQCILLKTRYVVGLTV